jgi:hypothetical protein
MKIETLVGTFIEVTSGNGTWGWLPYTNDKTDMVAIANAAIDPYWGKSQLTDNIGIGHGVMVVGTSAYWTVFDTAEAAQVEVSRITNIINGRGLGTINNNRSRLTIDKN